MTDALHTLSVSRIAAALRDGDTDAPAVTRHFLDRIERYEPALNSLVSRCDAEAVARADAVQVGESASDIAGIPLIQKDIFCTQGIKTSCGSKMLDNFVPPYNATSVASLAAAGSILLGKANMDEFAMGSSNETSYYGPVANPWDLARVPGGSSGGSAAAVAAGLAPMATGTDTGGSIRQPASLCGITGLKPTYGRVSRYGMIAFASSLDQAGCLARRAEDCALMLEHMAGFDRRDSTSVDEPVPAYHAALPVDTASLRGLKVGLPKEYFAEGLDDGTRRCVQAAIDELAGQGAEIIEVSLPNTELAVPTYYVLAPAEASSNLARFDGVRYGHRCADPVNLEDLYLRSRAEGFGREVQRRIMIGAYVLSAGYYDAYYLKAQKTRRLIADDFRRVFEQVDVIASPTTQSTAFKLGEKLDDPVTMYLNDIYTIPANLAGLPGISVPAGFDEGLPVGLQLLAPWFAEQKLLDVAHQYQQLTDWHLQWPEGYA